MEELNLNDLSKGSRSRISYLAKEYGSKEAVIEASIELLMKLVSQGKEPPIRYRSVNSQKGTRSKGDPLGNGLGSRK